MKPLNLKILAMASLGIQALAQAGPEYTPVAPKQKEKRPKMPLTSAELGTLSSLSGREKKKFLKSLKQKYSKAG